MTDTIVINNETSFTIKNKLFPINFEYNEEYTTEITYIAIKNPDNLYEYWYIFISPIYGTTIVIYNENGKRIGIQQNLDYLYNNEIELKISDFYLTVTDLGNGFIKINDLLILNIKQIVLNNDSIYTRYPKYNFKYISFEFPGDGTIKITPTGTIYKLDDFIKLHNAISKTDNFLYNEEERAKNISN
jgi:hypothetical protein